MKVLIISHMYPSTFNSMSGIFVHQQVQALVKQGCEVKVISPIPLAPFPINKLNSKWKAYSRVPYKAVLDSIDVYYPRYVEFPKGILFHKSGQLMASGISRTIEEIYKDFKFDIIHSNVALPDGYGAMRINENYGVPHVVTVHGQDFQNTLNKNEKCKQALVKVLDKVDKIITVSSKLKRLVQNEEFYSKIEVINNGIDEMYLHSKQDINEKKHAIKILSVSNLIKTKGIDININAIGKIIKKHPNIEYNIVGSGSEKEKLTELINKLGLQQNVKFLGKLEHSMVMQQMQECDIFSLPSYSEGFGVVYVEAMSQAKPVIGVKGEGIEDAIMNGHNGFLVERKDVEDLAKTLEFLINNEEKRIEIGENAKKTVEKNFTWNLNAKKVISIYNSLIK